MKTRQRPTAAKILKPNLFSIFSTLLPDFPAGPGFVNKFACVGRAVLRFPLLFGRFLAAGPFTDVQPDPAGYAGPAYIFPFECAVLLKIKGKIYLQYSRLSPVIRLEV
jgi:hypothetical protein